ncbi:MAG: DUF4363 family protein [Candidatus Improbicoccus devescovinae]|nr:MAG: DUF4363 family protein [Candidatus Improbicoccus devescovinae]
MKKFWIALFLFLFVLILCILNLNFATQTGKELDQKLVNFQNTKTLESAEEIVQTWEKKSKFFSIFMHHDSLDRISKGIAKIKASVQNNNIIYAGIEAEGIRVLIKVLKEADDINIKNLF